MLFNSVHFKNTVARCSINSKLCSIISWIKTKSADVLHIENDYYFLWTEHCATVFLKWMDFKKRYLILTKFLLVRYGPRQILFQNMFCIFGQLGLSTTLNIFRHVWTGMILKSIKYIRAGSRCQSPFENRWILCGVFW